MGVVRTKNVLQSQVVFTPQEVSTSVQALIMKHEVVVIASIVSSPGCSLQWKEGLLCLLLPPGCLVFVTEEGRILIQSKLQNYKRVLCVLVYFLECCIH